MTVRLPDRCGVLGGGTMGAGIAHALLLGGAEVRVAEADDAAAAAARDRVVRAVEASARRDVLTEPVEAVLARLVTGGGMGVLESCGLVVEAVPEDPAVKARMLAAVEERLDGDGVLASNTSSLSINELALGLQRPERFLGLHFFNPVPASDLVEIVTGSATTEGVTAMARDWVIAMGKTPIIVSDSPGFASSRLGLALGLEAIRMVQDGVASPADIDAAMTLGYKHPVGPLRLTDIVGLDVRLGIAEYLASKLGDRFAPPDLLREKVAEGELGRKSGRGFYDWPEEPSART